MSDCSELVRVCAEIELGGTWTTLNMAGNETDTHLLDGQVALTRGRQDWQSQMSPSTATFRVWNPTGDLSPSCNPDVVIGAPVRVGACDINPRFVPDGPSYFSTQDRAEFSGLTDRMRVSIDAQVVSERAGTTVLAAQWDPTTQVDVGWLWFLAEDQVVFQWTTDGGTSPLYAVFDNFSFNGGRLVASIFWDQTAGIAFLQVADEWGGEWRTVDQGTFTSAPMWDSSAPVRVGGVPAAGGDGPLTQSHTETCRTGPTKCPDNTQDRRQRALGIGPRTGEAPTIATSPEATNATETVEHGSQTTE